jgi:hypothetical protein
MRWAWRLEPDELTALFGSDLQRNQRVWHLCGRWMNRE